MYIRRRAVAVTFSAAMLAATISACGGSAQPTAATSSRPASSDPLAGLSANQIAIRALTVSEGAPFVHFTGSATDSGKTVTFDLMLVAGEGCQGTMSEATLGSFQLVYKGSAAWVRPDKHFYQSVGAGTAALTVLGGKYLKVTPNAGLGQLVDLCSVRKLLTSNSKGITSGAPLRKGAGTVIDGQSAVKLSDLSDNAYAYVSDAAQPELLQVTDPGSGGSISFSYPATRPAITPPPAVEVLDGAKYGF